MRILFITNFYPPHDLGGMELRCEEVVTQLRHRNHDCYVLTSSYGTSEKSLTETGVDRALILETDIQHYQPLDFFLHRLQRQYANREILRKVLETFQPDLAFIWGMWNLSPQIACWTEQWMPKRTAYHLAGYWPIENDPHTEYWNHVSKRDDKRFSLWLVAQLAQVILWLERYPPKPQFGCVSCCSRFVASLLSERGVFSSDPRVILNGIDPAPFLSIRPRNYVKDEPLRLLYFGGLMEQKGVHTAIQALGQLHQDGHAQRLSLTIVGGGNKSYEARLRALVMAFALEDKVHFVERVPRSEIPRILANHHVHLFTSCWPEPFGRTVLEAMAAGMAVIGTAVGGSAEIFGHYPREALFTPGDPSALARHIRTLQENPQMVHHLGKAGQSLVQKHFTLERMVTEMEEWLYEIVV